MMAGCKSGKGMKGKGMGMMKSGTKKEMGMGMMKGYGKKK